MSKIPKDLFGQYISTGDYVIATVRHEENELMGFQVIGISEKGFLKFKPDKYRWARTQLQNTKHCVKITEAQFKQLKPPVS